MLPRGICQQDHATHETLELAERESPFDWALGSHSPGGDRVSHYRALGADARSLLGGNRDSVVMQSTLGATLTLCIDSLKFQSGSLLPFSWSRYGRNGLRLPQKMRINKPKRRRSQSTL